MNKEKRILLISTGQPSLNPRLVKEADALHDAGYHVIVLYQYWNHWGTEHDKQLLSTKKWKFIRVGGSPSKGKMVFTISRLIHKCSRFLNKKLNNFIIPELAASRSSLLFYFEAKKHVCDLVIAHNLAALPFAYMAANYHKVSVGFDAEDFHRFENSDNLQDADVKLKIYLEEKYFPKLHYLTTASYLITEEYLKLFPSLKKVKTILNVFPKQTTHSRKTTSMYLEKLRMFWFSQTIGLNRGLESVIQAIGSCRHNLKIELHLLGNFNEETEKTFLKLIAQAGLPSSSLTFYKPIPSDEIVNFATQFDIGLATETGIPYNRDICLTNKIFTYIQAGLPVLASNTSAQTDLLKRIQDIGAIYKRDDILSLSNQLDTYFEHPELLSLQKANSIKAAGDYNWEQEKEKFLSLIKSVI